MKDDDPSVEPTIEVRVFLSFLWRVTLCSTQVRFSSTLGPAFTRMVALRRCQIPLSVAPESERALGSSVHALPLFAISRWWNALQLRSTALTSFILFKRALPSCHDRAHRQGFARKIMCPENDAQD